MENNQAQIRKVENQLCEWGMVMGGCFDGYPPMRIWKGIHELCLGDNDETRMFVCSDCLNFNYINDEEKLEGRDYNLDLIDREALNKWNNEQEKRDMKRAEYLERNPRK